MQHTTLVNGTGYAARVAQRVPDAALRTAVYRSGAFLYKGDARAVRVAVNYEL